MKRCFDKIYSIFLVYLKCSYIGDYCSTVRLCWRWNVAHIVCSLIFYASFAWHTFCWILISFIRCGYIQHIYSWSTIKNLTSGVWLFILNQIFDQSPIILRSLLVCCGFIFSSLLNLFCSEAIFCCGIPSLHFLFVFFSVQWIGNFTKWYSLYQCATSPQSINTHIINREKWNKAQ